MKKTFVSARRKGMLLLCISLFAAAGGSALEDVLTVADIMQRMTAHHNRAEERILKGKIDSELFGHVREMSSLFKALRESYKPFYGGSPENWRGFCDQGLTALEATRKALGDRDLASVRSSFQRLAAVREEAHREFQPGLWKRLMRKFRRKK